MAIKLGEIYVSLGLSTASFTTNLNKAKDLCFGNVKEMERSFKIMGTALVSAAAAGGSALALLTRQAIDNADHMGKLAQTTGMSVEKFSALDYAARRSDIETATLAKGLVILAKNLEKANQQTLEGKAAHSALSTLFHGAIPAFKDTSDAFQQIAAKLSLLPDGYQKTALAAQIFGRSGAELIPMLGTLTEVTQRFQRMGLEIGGKTAAQAAQFNEKLKDLKAGVSALGLGIASELLPKLNELTEALGNSNRADMGSWLGKQVASAINTFQRMAVSAAMTNVRDEMGAKAFAGQDISSERAELNLLQNRMNELRLEQARLLGDIPPLTAATEKHAQAAAALGETVKAAKDKVAEFTQGLRDQIFEHTHNIIAINAYKAAQLGANEADQAAIAILSRKLFFLDLQKKGLEHPKLPAAAPITMDNLPSFAGERLQAQLAPPPGLMLGMPESIQHAAEEARSLQTALVGVSKTPLKPLSDQMRDLALGTKVWGDRSLEALGNWIVEGGSFRKVLAGILEDFAKMIIQIIVMGTLKRMFNSLLGNIFGFAEGGIIPGLASGGLVFGSGPFLVGERGPELFMPPASGGMIVPHNRLPDFAGVGSTAIVNNYNIDNRGADIGTTAKTAALLDRFSIEQYHRMVLDRQARTA